MRFSIPPYPLEVEKIEDSQKVRPNLRVPIRGLNDKNAGSFYFYEVMEEDGKLVHSVGTGLLGVAVGVADRPHDAWDKSYDLLRELKVPELQYRTDLRREIGDMYEMTEYQDEATATLGIIPELELESNG